MQKGKYLLSGLLLLWIFVLEFCPAHGAAVLFPNRAQGWNRIPTIVVSGKEGDPRIQLVREAVDFWNKQLSDLGSGFRLGPVTFTKETIPTEELAARSEAVLAKEGALKPTGSLMKIDGDLIVALSDGDFVSFTVPERRKATRGHPRISSMAADAP